MYKKIMEAYVRAWEELDSLDALEVRSIHNLYEKALGYAPLTAEDLQIISEVYFPDCTLNELLEKDYTSPISDRALLDKCIERGLNATWDTDPDLDAAAEYIARELQIRNCAPANLNPTRIMLVSLAAGKAIGEEQQRIRSRKTIDDLVSKLCAIPA